MASTTTPKAKPVHGPDSTPDTVKAEKAVRKQPEKINVAALRSTSSAVPVDQMNRRSDADALHGHFVSIDLSKKAVRDAVESVVGEGQARFGNGDYGVLIESGDLDEHGYPLTAIVALRDDNAPARVIVPYDSLSPAEAGRR
jgi:hypothetical protein